MENKPKNFKAGDLTRFIYGPSRWRGDQIRDPGTALLGTFAIILERVRGDNHNWGGRWRIYHFDSGGEMEHWGDFMEIAE